VFWRCWWLETRNSPDIARRVRPIEVVIIRSYGTRNWQEKCRVVGELRYVLSCKTPTTFVSVTVNCMNTISVA
jgi:hypothetical protein